MTPQAALKSIPKKIKVGPHIYRVRAVDAIGDDPDAMAQLNTGDQIIEIVRDHKTASLVVGSLIHELIHAIYADRDLDNASEERTCIQLESALVQLFQDNPALLVWIGKGLKK